METPAQPNSSSAASLTHAAIQRLGQQSASCKLTSAILSGAAMLFASGRVGGEGLLWAAAPMGLLALADASYAAKTRRLFDLAGQLDGNRAPKPGEVIQREVGTGSVSEAVGSLKGLLSFSVWPYYTSLALVVAGLGSTVLVPKAGPAPVYPSQPFAGLPGQMPARSTVGQPSPVFPSGTQRSTFPVGSNGQPSTGGQPGMPPVAMPQAPNRVINRFPPSGSAPQSGGQSAPGATTSSGGSPIAPPPRPSSPPPAGAGATAKPTTPPPSAPPPAAAPQQAK